jgi:hypothetical protein
VQVGLLHSLACPFQNYLFTTAWKPLTNTVAWHFRSFIYCLCP